MAVPFPSFLDILRPALPPILADLEASGPDSPVARIGRAGEHQSLRSLLDDPRPRRCPTPVGSDAWVQLLGSGGGEDLDEALR